MGVAAAVGASAGAVLFVLGAGLYRFHGKRSTRSATISRATTVQAEVKPAIEAEPVRGEMDPGNRQGW